MLVGNPNEDLVHIRPDAEEARRVVKRSAAIRDAILREGASPTVFRPEIIRAYMKAMQRRATPAGVGTRGQKLLKLAYQRYNEVIPLFWDWIPGPQVIGFCPECFVNAPATVGPRTRPTFFEQRLAWISGDPEADSKYVLFHLRASEFTMSLDSRDRLTVREIIRCPSGRHGKDDRIVRKCTWAARVEDGIVTQVPRRLIRAGTPKPFAGPLILVK